ncbi:MAG: hypothetical protein ACTSP3_13215, partial [Candidatus Heimdallarchaeaceae archaeon]
SEIEHLLANILGFHNLSRSKQNTIKSRMNSFRRRDNLNKGIFLELYLYSQMITNSNITQILYENFVNSHHDFRIVVKDTEFNLEVTGLGENNVNQILEKSFRNAGEYLLNIMPEDCLLNLYIDIRKLKNHDDIFDENYSTNLLKSTIDTLKPILFISDSTVNFSENAFLKGTNCTLYQLYKFYNQKVIDAFQEENIFKVITKLIESQVNDEFLNSIMSSDIIELPIVSYLNTTLPGRKCAEIASWHLFPTLSEEERIEARINQIKRKLIVKLDKNQLENQINPILVFHFSEFPFSNYSNDVLTMFDFLQEILPVVKHCFKEQNKRAISNILGIVFYEEYLEKGIFVKNPFIKIEEEIEGKIKLITRVV